MTVPDSALKVRGQDTPPGAAPAGQTIRRKLSAYPQTVTDWLWPGWVPCAELSVLAGDGGVSKSTLAGGIAAEVTRGRYVGAIETRQVLIVLGEDDPGRVLVSRMRAAGADMDRVEILSVSDGFGSERTITLPDHTRQLTEAVRDLRPDLVIVDPITAHLATSVDAHRDGGQGGLRAVLGPLAAIAHQYGPAVMCVAHLNKGAGSPAQRLAGTAGLRNATRNLLMLVEHPDACTTGANDGRRIVGHNKCNYGPLQRSLSAVVESVLAVQADGSPIRGRDGETVTAPVVRIGSASDVDYADAMRTSTNDDGHSAEADAVDFLRQELADGEVPTKELTASARDAGISPRTLERALAALKVNSAKRGKAWVRFLPVGGVGGVESNPESPVFMGFPGETGASDSPTPPSPPRKVELAELNPSTVVEMFPDALPAPVCKCDRPLPAPDEGELRCSACGRACATWGTPA